MTAAVGRVATGIGGGVLPPGSKGPGGKLTEGGKKAGLGAAGATGKGAGASSTKRGFGK